MIPIIILCIFFFFSLLYFISSIYLIKQNDFSMEETDNVNINWFLSLGTNGIKLTYVMSNIIAINATGVLVSFCWFLGSRKYIKDDIESVGVYIIVACICIIFSIFLMFAIGTKIITNIDENNIRVPNTIMNITDIIVSIPETLSNIDNYNYNYTVIDEKKNYFTYQCCICLDEKEFIYRSKIIPCEHDLFCKNCIKNITNNCPICRGTINQISIMIKNPSKINIL